MKNAELPQFLTHIEHFEWKKRGLNSFSLIFSDI